MAVVNRYSVDLEFRNFAAFQQLKVRVSGFREVFEAIIERWIAHNQHKFEEARGSQLSGVVFDAEVEPVYWKGLSDDYAAQKSRQGFENWLMVRNGDLMASLLDRGMGGWWEEVEPLYAIFGTIHQHAEWNALTRPVNFLDAEDRQMIRDMFGAYMNGNPPFKAYQRGDAQRMDADFKSQFAGVTLPGLPPR